MSYLRVALVHTRFSQYCADGQNPEHAPGKDDGHRIIAAPPGLLGLTLEISKGGGGTVSVKAIGPGCAFRDEIRVGDHVVTIDGRRLSEIGELHAGVDRVRRLGIYRPPLDDIDAFLRGRGCLPAAGNGVGVEKAAEARESKARKRKRTEEYMADDIRDGGVPDEIRTEYKLDAGSAVGGKTAVSDVQPRHPPPGYYQGYRYCWPAHPAQYPDVSEAPNYLRQECQTQQWETSYAAIVDFKNRRSSLPAGGHLHGWLTAQASLVGSPGISTERIVRLAVLGADLPAENVRKLTWEDKLKAIVLFRKRFGLLPATGQLRNWLEELLSSAIPKGRVMKLAEAGVEPSTENLRDLSWEDKHEAIVVFKKRGGLLQAGGGLSGWLKEQTNAIGSAHFLTERAVKLLEIGAKPSTKNLQRWRDQIGSKRFSRLYGEVILGSVTKEDPPPWEDSYKAVIKFKKRSGSFPVDGLLHGWLEEQTEAIGSPDISVEHAMKLVEGLKLPMKYLHKLRDQMGGAAFSCRYEKIICTDVARNDFMTWEDRHRAVIRFKKRCGFLPLGGHLHSWLEEQRREIESSAVSTERVMKLVDAGVELLAENLENLRHQMGTAAFARRYGENILPTSTAPLTHAPNGFEYIGKKIEYLMHAWNPDAIKPDAPKEERKKAIEKAVFTKQSMIPRLIKSGFRAKLGRVAVKRPPEGEEAISASVRQSKRLRASASLAKSPPISSAGHRIPTSEARFPEDLIAPPHRPIPHSVQSAPYRRLKPGQMVRLDLEDEIILVVPEVTADTPELCRPALAEIHKRIDSVLMKSCVGRTAKERNAQLAVLKHRHNRVRGSSTVFEFPVRVKKYVDRDQVSSDGMRQSDLDRLWEDGFGINVEVCGYARSTLVFVRMENLAYVEAFQRSDCFASDEIAFTERLGDANEQLLKQLWEAHGCTTTTMEIMMKFYKAHASARRSRILRLESKVSKQHESLAEATAALSQMQSQVSKQQEEIECLRREVDELRGAPMEAEDELPIPRPLLRKVSELGLSGRAENFLKSENIVYIGDLVQCKESEMVKKPKFGLKSLNEIKQVLADIGLRLGMDEYKHFDHKKEDKGETKLGTVDAPSGSSAVEEMLEKKWIAFSQNLETKHRMEMNRLISVSATENFRLIEGTEGQFLCEHCKHVIETPKCEREHLKGRLVDCLKLHEKGCKLLSLSNGKCKCGKALSDFKNFTGFFHHAKSCDGIKLCPVCGIKQSSDYSKRKEYYDHVKRCKGAESVIANRKKATNRRLPKGISEIQSSFIP